MNKKTMIFVAMSSEFKYEDFYTVIRLLAADLGAEAIRVDDDKIILKSIREEIVSRIKQADIIVAEISTLSPNVMYEVGWAHALNKPTIIFADENTKIPFDIEDYKVIKYDYDDRKTTIDLLSTFKHGFEKFYFESVNVSNFRQPVVELLEEIDKLQESNPLYRKLALGSIEKLTDEAKQWLGDKININMSEAVEKGIRIFQNLQHGGFATYLVNINDYWLKDNEYLRECRRVSKGKDKKITRVYIFPNFDFLNNDNLRELIRLDEEANIDTRIVFEPELAKHDIIKDFGIWDDEVVCLMKVSSSDSEYNVTGGYFSCNDKDLDNARNWEKVILTYAKESKEIYGSIANLSKSSQELFTTIYRMEMTAEKYCQGSYLPKHQESCKWYHGAWPYLRLLGMVSTPDWHEDFYINALGNIDFSKINHILISGTADYSMLSYVLPSIPLNHLRDITITVLDICDTPLEMCRRYKENYEKETRQRFNLRYENSDALDTLIQEETVDLIITDAFITRFNQLDKVKLLTEWKRILKPDGCVITTARLTQKTMPIVKANQIEIERFCEKVRDRVLHNFPWLIYSLDHVQQLALDYGQNMCSYPFSSKESIRELFKGFRLNVEYVAVSGEFEEKTLYSRIIANKIS